MKKNIFTFIAISLLGFLTGCSENDVLNDVQKAAADQASSVISGTASLDLDEMNGVLNATPTTRTTVIYNSNKKLSYRLKKGDRIPVFVYYKQDNRQKIVEDEVYVVEGNRLRFDTKIPADFDRRKGNLYMGAVMGKQPGVNNGAWASGMTADGKLRIEVSHTVDAASQQFNLPFCAPLKLIKPSGDIYLHFKALGSWFAVTLNVQKDINPDFMVVNSDVVATNGTLDLFSSKNGEFIWQPEVTTQKNIRYDVKNFEVKAKQESKPLIVWFMPILNKESQQPTTLSLQTKATYSSKMLQYSKKVFDKNEQLKNNKTYNVNITEDAPVCDKGLVITQFWSTRKNRCCNRNVLQITNISDHDISLEGYYLVRSVFGSAETPSGVIDLGNLEENNAQFLYNDRQKKVLPSGASLLITGFNRRVAEGTFDYCDDEIYQIALLGEDENLLQQFVPEGNRDRWGRESNCHFCNAYFLTFNGTDISLSKPNDIVDNFGRDACGRIYNFQFLNRTYYRVPYCYIYMGEQGLGGEATHLYKPERRVYYPGSYWGPMENFSTCSWRFENENKITSLGFWGKYGDIFMFRNNMY
ncbi:hypothetical protein LK429_05105 [Hoylesella buccalis]|uniref:hypothetical protein n=1 Tax=Hoylesella buccalis TaxID=28127 RepID=UPI001D14B623|nr:hypothetical protein [Hoylesella buccalis]UEA63931.1 hypothetical protein LK429_05105 [Hoylesella buccalis]UWP48776.1 hypothetical protein NQ518_09525 [Hoylesella buccalis ATCC 35310]